MLTQLKKLKLSEINLSASCTFLLCFIIIEPPKIKTSSFSTVLWVSLYANKKLDLLVYLSVCIQLTSKRLNRSGPHFLWHLAWPQGRFMDDQFFKNLPQSKFYFKFFSQFPIFFIKSAKIFVFVNTENHHVIY